MKRKLNNCLVCGEVMYAQNRREQKYCRHCYRIITSINKIGLSTEMIIIKAKMIYEGGKK
ncbi:MAG: hypothetical protein WC307_05175 [Candidatus Nanoarchaeia archaeon]|jgi:hypothetical protein